MPVRQILLTMVAAIAASACSHTPPANPIYGEYLSARLAARHNDIATAASGFAEVYRRAPGTQENLERAFFFLLADGQLEEAVALAPAMLTRERDDYHGMARLVMAADALTKGTPAVARTYLEKPFSAPYLSSIAYLMDVWVEDALLSPAAAVAKLDRSADDVYRGFNPLHNAFLAEKADQIEAAKAAYQVSLMGYGGALARAAYGAFLERHGTRDDQGRPIEAEEFYRVLAGEGGGAARLAALGLDRLEGGQSSKAYQAVQARQGSAFVFYTFSGAILEQTLQQRERAEAVGLSVGKPHYELPLTLIQMALYLQPSFTEARYLLGQILYMMEDHDSAVEALSKVPSNSYLYADAQMQIARSYAAHEEYEKAAKLLRRLIDRNMSDASIRLTLSSLYTSMDAYNLGVEQLDEVLASPQTPDHMQWRAYLARGAAYLSLDQWDNAEADLKKAVELAPDEAETLNYLGYSWAERGIHLEEAFELIQKAVELAPQSGAIIDSLGWAYYQLGSYDKALPQLEKAVSLSPEDVTITDHLGDCYWQLGRQIEARYQWRHALELSPDRAQQTSLERKIKEGITNDGHNR